MDIKYYFVIELLLGLSELIYAKCLEQSWYIVL